MPICHDRGQIAASSRGEERSRCSSSPAASRRRSADTVVAPNRGWPRHRPLMSHATAAATSHDGLRLPVHLHSRRPSGTTPPVPFLLFPRHGQGLLIVPKKIKSSTGFPFFPLDLLHSPDVVLHRVPLSNITHQIG